MREPLGATTTGSCAASPLRLSDEREEMRRPRNHIGEIHCEGAARYLLAEVGGNLGDDEAKRSPGDGAINLKIGALEGCQGPSGESYISSCDAATCIYGLLVVHVRWYPMFTSSQLRDRRRLTR